MVAKYQSVIDLYKLTAIDIDIEGSDIANTGATDLRNQAMAVLKNNNPNLRISYTIPVNTDGLDDQGTYVLQSANNYGFQLDGNITV